MKCCDLGNGLTVVLDKGAGVNSKAWKWLRVSLLSVLLEVFGPGPYVVMGSSLV